MTETVIHVSLPLDPDGFLRRECPYCTREWKRVGIGDDPQTCPYCEYKAAADAFFTKAQTAYIHAQSLNGTGIGSAIDELGVAIGHLGGSVDTTLGGARLVGPPTEGVDMKRHDLACHGPVKVVDGWTAAVHCPTCGST